MLRPSPILPQTHRTMGNCIPRLFAVCCRAAGKLKTKTMMKHAAVRVQNIIALIVVALAVLPAHAQLAPPNDAGVTMGHVHLAVKDVEAQKRFWSTTMGGTAVQNGPLSLIQFPGAFIMLR